MSSKTKAKFSKKLYKLYYSLYKLDIKDNDQIYQRSNIALILLPILGVLTYNLGRIDILDQIFTRIDVFLYYLFTFIAYLCLGCSVVFAILFILPRKNKYETLDVKKIYQDLNHTGKQSKKKEQSRFCKITKKLAEIVVNNDPINEKRRGYFHLCLLWASYAIGSIGLQAIFLLILKLQYCINFCQLLRISCEYI